jgi:hypothetical protein
MSNYNTKQIEEKIRRFWDKKKSLNLIVRARKKFIP